MNKLLESEQKMKLRNRNTGEVVNFIGICVEDDRYELATRQNGHKTHTAWYYDSLEDLLKEWEDCEEPKEFWYIGQDGVIFSDTDTITQDYANRLQAIGNYFETEEEAEKAVEKLKAWKRLKDAGFKFRGWESDKAEHNYAIIHCFMPSLTKKNGIWKSMVFKDIQNILDLLFGGEE